MYIIYPTYKKSKYIFIRIYDLFRILSYRMILIRNIYLKYIKEEEIYFDFTIVSETNQIINN